MSVGDALQQADAPSSVTDARRAYAEAERAFVAGLISRDDLDRLKDSLLALPIWGPGIREEVRTAMLAHLPTQETPR